MFENLNLAKKQQQCKTINLTILFTSSSTAFITSLLKGGLGLLYLTSRIGLAFVFGFPSFYCDIVLRKG